VRTGAILTLAIQKFSQFPLIFNYRKNFAKVRSASFLWNKGVLKNFGCSVEIWCDFPNVAILVFLVCWHLDGFQRNTPSYTFLSLSLIARCSTVFAYFPKNRRGTPKSKFQRNASWFSRGQNQLFGPCIENQNRTLLLTCS
jgi:hypothetical protein